MALGALRFAIVGSGPSGFYVAKYLLKARSDCMIDMIERWPTPFGLVRFGVAPDHPDVKSVVDDFDDVIKSSAGRLRFFGNVHVGKDVALARLKEAYDGVVLACGASGERKLGIPGEDLVGVSSARRFVGWYNSEPGQAEDPPLGDKCVVIGQGNVALDCARVLAAVPDTLAHTDISRHSLDKLMEQPSERHISIIGRRGAAQAAFTIKELRELSAIASVVVDPHELMLGDTEASQVELKEMRAIARKFKLIQEMANTSPEASPRRVDLRFLLSPRAFEASEKDPMRLGRVVFERCRLEGAAHAQRAIGTGELVAIEASMALAAVGYTSQLPEPYHTLNTLPNEKGFVEDNVFCVGWCKRGPSGIIGSNISDAKETVASLLARFSQSSSGSDNQDIATTLPHATDWADWQALDQHERHEGAKIGASRLKIREPTDMLQIIRAANA